MLDIVMNSLYQLKDVSFHEMITNESDDNDKLCFLDISQHELMAGKEDL